ncbi:MAG: flippase-like domain-containing protein [Acidobacteria bacterium]|nr:flippase-like domain-containing protein [Acidobacteriota bacterium]
MSWTSRLIPVGVALAGIALVIWQVQSVGLDEVVQGFKSVGLVGFALVLALSFLRYTVRAIAWITLIEPPPGQPPVPVRSAIAATIGGDALGNLSFLSLLVSEPAKALYLTRYVPAEEALGALAAENFFYSVSVALVILAGTATLLSSYVLPADWLTASWVAVGLMGTILAAAVFLAWKRPEVAARFGASDAHLLGRVMGRIGALERIAYRGLRVSSSRMVVVVSCQIAFHVLSILESWLTLYYLTGQSSWLNAFLFDTINRVINVVFRAVPLRVGVDEASASGLADLIGLTTATGLTMALIRRVRVLTWVAVGLVITGRRVLRRT